MLMQLAHDLGGGSLAHRQVCVLAVEDNPGDARLVREALRKMPAFRLVEAGDLETAISMGMEGGIDICLLDLGLPESQGIETLERFRRAAPLIPVVVLTGLADDDLAIDALRQGAQDYLTKGSYEQHVLVRTLRHSLERFRLEQELRERESELAAIYAHVPIGLLVVDDNGRIHKANRTAIDIGGLAEESYHGQLEGKAFFCHFAEGRSGRCRFSVQCEACTIGRLLRESFATNEEQHQVEVSMIGNGQEDGVPETFLVSTIPLVQGSSLRMLLALENITERKRTEEALRQSETRYRTIVNMAPDGIAVQQDGRIVFANPAGSQMLCIGGAEEMLGQLIEEIADSGFKEGAQSRTRKGEGEVPGLVPVLQRYVEGGEECLDVEVTAAPVVYNTRPAVQVVIRDISERRRLEAEAVRARDFCLTLFEDFPVPIWRANTRGERDYLNRTWLAFTGRALHDEVGSGWLANVHENDREHYLVSYIDSIEARQPFQTEYRLQDAQGDYHWMVDRGRPYYDIDGKFGGYIGTSHDVTNQKLASEKLAAALAEKESLLREVHHRVKNNMQVVSSLLNLQLQASSDSGVRSLLTESKDRIRSMALVHEQLYRSASFASIDVGAYVRHLVENVKTSYEWTDHRIDIIVDITGVRLGIDTTIPLGLVVNELLTNAFKYAFPNGRKGYIRVDLRREEESCLILTVSDNGVGLPPGFTLEGAQTVGLGIVQILVGQLEGSLSVLQEPETTFILNFREQADGQQ